MGTVTTPPVERARSIFQDLGYTLDGDGAEFRAEREWKLVHVKAMAEVRETPDSGELRCFVTYPDTAPNLRERLLEHEPDYDWAIISVDDDGDSYEVIHPEEISTV